MVIVSLLSSAELTPRSREQLSRLWADAFGDRFTADDAAHAFGGVHVLVQDDAVLLAHASVVPRTLLVGDRPVAAGYVEGVATRPDRQRQGHGGRAMTALHDVVREQFEIGALSTSRQSFYRRLGWLRWAGPSFVLRDGMRVRTENEDDDLMVLPFGSTAGIDLTQPICCEDRPGDVW